MKSTLYCEASTDQDRGITGWGAAWVGGDRTVLLAGELPWGRGGSCTLLELDALAAAVDDAVAQGLIVRRDDVTLAMRSTGPMAVLQWVFPDAGFECAVPTPKPIRLRRETQDAEALVRLHDTYEELELRISLRQVAESPETLQALSWARRTRQDATLARRSAR